MLLAQVSNTRCAQVCGSSDVLRATAKSVLTKLLPSICSIDAKALRLLNRRTVRLSHAHNHFALAFKGVTSMRRKHVVQQQHIAFIPAKYDLFPLVHFADAVQVT